MLSAEHRLTESALFASAVRHGQRVGGHNLVMHLKSRESGEPALVGFVVSKAVGNAVVRNKVKRRLRAVLSQHVDELTPGSLLVVRALPSSADAEFKVLAGDVRRGLDRLTDRPAA